MPVDVRMAIAVHHTATTDDAWDAGAQVKALGDSPTEAALRRMHAWVDPDGESTAKASYKFPHHMVSNGNVGAANLRACSATIAALNGGRGGTSIPSGDRQGVWSHVAAHIRDASREPPELKSAWEAEEREYRAFPMEIEVEERADGDLPGSKLVGHAAVFDTPWQRFKDFIEVIRYGTFTKTIQESDIRALWNHNTDIVLGRNRNKTLELGENQRGLSTVIHAPDTQLVNDMVVAPIRRGDVTGMSIAFVVVKQNVTEDAETGVITREILEAKLFEVSPVTFPAYVTTDVGARSLRSSLDEVALIVMRHHSGLPLRGDDRESLRYMQDLCSSLLCDPAQQGQSEGQATVPPPTAKLAGAKSRLLKELTAL